jgi:hypothetical protein
MLLNILKVLIHSEVVEKAVFNYYIFGHSLIFFISHFFGARSLYFYPLILLVTREPHSILLIPL